jgi:hypothetical protein
MLLFGAVVAAIALVLGGAVVVVIDATRGSGRG